MQAHDYRLSYFVRWCESVENLDNVNDFSGIPFNRDKIWRREDGDPNNDSVATQLSTLRVFIKGAESIDAVYKGLYGYNSVPTMAPKQEFEKLYSKTMRPQICNTISGNLITSPAITLFSNCFGTLAYGQECYGREPLITTAHGRISKNTVRHTIYNLTQPCDYLDNCPHNRKIETCEGVQQGHIASKSFY